jgi:hypothetical protein
MQGKALKLKRIKERIKGKIEIVTDVKLRTFFFLQCAPSINGSDTVSIKTPSLKLKFGRWKVLYTLFKECGIIHACPLQFYTQLTFQS